MIHISFDTTDAAWGGANQFLKGLKNEFEKMGCYSDDLNKVDVVLFNSHHNIEIVQRLKQELPKEVKFFHRVDGPMKLYNSSTDQRDLLVSHLNDQIADATIFQSRWSREKCFEENICSNEKPHTVIINACNPDVFYPVDKKFASFQAEIKLQPHEPCRLISTSFSDNPNKGFFFYKKAETILDPQEYEYYFLGRNSSVVFENIKEMGIQDSKGVSDLLRKSDIYITASLNDPCSNSLLEAISTKIPCLAYDSGGHSEIIKKTEGGLLFKDLDDFKIKLNNIKNNYRSYRSNIKPLNIKDVANEYFKFFYN